MAGRSQKNKPHKSRFSSKARPKFLSAGLKAKNVGVNLQAAKEMRLQRSKNIRDNKRAMLLSEKRATSGQSTSPRILVLISLCDGVQIEGLKQRILSACNNETPSDVMVMEDDVLSVTNITTTSVPRHKLRLTVMHPPSNDLQCCLEAAKVADIIAFALPATPASDGETYVDKAGKVRLSMLKAHGLPNCVGLLTGLCDVPVKKRAEMKKLAVSGIQSELPPDTKIFSADNGDECQQVLRHITEQRYPHLQWRAQRPFVMAEQLELKLDSDSTGTLLLSGYVREQRLSVNQLIHVAGADYQISKIDILPDPYPLQLKQKPVKTDATSMLVDEEVKTLLPDLNLQEPLVVQNIPDSLSGEQTWPTEEELANADKPHSNKTRKRRNLPKGTSAYQAAWIVDDVDNEEESEEEEGEKENNDDNASAVCSMSEWGDEEESENESMNDDDEAQMEALKTAAAHRDNQEFPDEVDTPLNVAARERFAKYRGLKSFRTSEWDPKESLPAEYARVFAFDNFKRTYKHVVDKVKNMRSESCVSVGTFVRLHIGGVTSKVAAHILHSSSPTVACGLLPHESKMSVLHFSIKKHDSFSNPIKSKEELIFHIGFRRFTTRAIFSSDDINMNKHKYERFLQPSQFSIASIFAPISFPPMPLIVMKSEEDGVFKYVASGSLRSVDPDRIILKKIILSGYPVRVSKRKAVVRYMFHNPEDVQWFKPIEVWTKYGRRGRIMEPVGTHGAMKCIFDGVVQQRDSVCINLFKRVYPKWPSD